MNVPWAFESKVTLFREIMIFLWSKTCYMYYSHLCIYIFCHLGMINFGNGLLTFPSISMGLTFFFPLFLTLLFTFWWKYSKKVKTPDAGSSAWFEYQLCPHKLTDLASTVKSHHLLYWALGKISMNYCV